MSAISPVLAAPPAIAESPCDTKYYESLKSRAWLEAQREITQNQNLIFKPDSVLQYTCFDQFIGVLSTRAGGMFSDSPPPRDSTMADALGNLVGGTVTKYLSMNFGHKMLGGRADIPYPASSAGTYNCSMMNQVWMQAKCKNFIDINTQDGFFTFSQYKVPPDKRGLPIACNGSQNWDPEIEKSTGPQTEWTEDIVQTFFKEMNECTGTGTGATMPIGTGIFVSRGTGGNYYEEKFCIPPGCSYSPPSGGQGDDGAAASGGKCEPSKPPAQQEPTGDN